LKKVLKKEFVTVNGKIATTATYISGGEEIELTIPDQALPKKKLRFPLKVLFEDEHLAVIYKPAGISVSGNRFKTVANALAQNLKISTLADSTQPQPVHRLDYPTTGSLLVGKTSSSIRALNQMFEDKQILKTYYAVTIGEMPLADVINTQIDGKRAVTKLEIKESVFSKRFGQLNLVKLSPQTGRKHQLRIHLSSRGNPILGDKDYGIPNLILNGKGLYLHALTLNFIHPFTSKKLEVKSLLPERFLKIFKS